MLARDITDEKEIAVGDRVAFGVRVGNSSGLRLGRVVSLEDHHWCGTIVNIRTDGQRDTSRPPNEVAVLVW